MFVPLGLLFLAGSFLPWSKTTGRTVLLTSACVSFLVEVVLVVVGAA